jgi:hypothetical protein
MRARTFPPSTRFKKLLSPVVNEQQTHLDGSRIAVLPLLPYFTNRHGLFAWSHWDGKLWKNAGLSYYHRSQLVFKAKRTERSLRHTQSESKSQPAVVNRFWIEHYRGSHAANLSIVPFNLLHVGSQAIKYILRTSPLNIYKRVSETVHALDLNTFELLELIKDLDKIRSVAVHRRQNPTYFKAAVERYQRVAAGHKVAIGDRFHYKSARVHHKLAFGQKWKSHTPSVRKVHHGQKPDEWHRQLVSVCSACPPRWTIEPMQTIMTLTLRQLSQSYRNVYNGLNAGCGRKIPTAAFHQLRMLIDNSRDCSMELYELVDEMAALRYHRLQLFPDSFSLAEVQLGEQLWLRSGI